MKTHKNPKGFGVVEMLLVPLAISIVGFAGWFVWSRQEGKEGTTRTTLKDSAQQATTSKPESTNQTIPEDYATYENKNAGFKFSYPKNWGTLIYTGGPQANLINDGLGGRMLIADFQNGDSEVFPRANELRGGTGIGVDEGLYGGGYIEKQGKYYSVAKYSGEEIQIPNDKILATVKSGLGKVLVLKTGTIAGTEVQLLLNLPETSNLTGLSMRFVTGNYQFAEEGKLDDKGLEVLKQVAGTFSPL